jgi:type IV pilus assembly protein PilA
VTVANGDITIAYKPAVGGSPNQGGNNIIITPNTSSGGSVQWDCTSGNVLGKYRPANCR